MKQQERSVLSNVIAVARRELDDRDEKEIPARMRKVAKCGGHGLPPPFQMSLLEELRKNDSFRESVLERWESETLDDPVGHAFLVDPESGIDGVSEQAEARTRASLEAELERAAQTIVSLEARIAESKTRLADAGKRLNAEIAGRDAAAEASRASLERSVRDLKRRVSQLEADQGGHGSVVESLRSEIEILNGKLERSVARAHRKAEKDHVKVRRTMSPPTDPVEFAAWLDTAEKHQRSFRRARVGEFEVATDRPPLRIPGGLLPDSYEALVALIGQEPDVIYIDGYNFGAMLEDDFSTARARTRVVAIADRLASASRGRVVVVFDAVGVEGRPSLPSPGPVEVRFTHAQIADDEIVEMIRVDPSRAAVITSDRELSNRCADEGCVTVWSEALVQWAGR